MTDKLQLSLRVPHQQQQHPTITAEPAIGTTNNTWMGDPIHKRPNHKRPNHKRPNHKRPNI
ncbi:hypothetical protein DAPPUDRAFT_252647 [Daphnia pulex]|uniref:Uncharacterized protein n=1 Tax=Daphnia pulex TaxID=6669 RepID=E9H367_DAPPU|nr:hypothetical protein DAPPUDRAFT_252647 [Daphnia pulex]|eukprot:EFX73705.1 hypothetical protein DAPPUDRAFT_252647 [Daphnia pulex]